MHSLRSSLVLLFACLFMSMITQAISRAAGGYWPTDGVPVANGGQLDGAPVMVSDGFGGTFVAWSTAPAGGGDYKIFINRVYPNGNLPGYWDLNGRAVSTASGADEFAPAMVADGAGGAIVAWLAGKRIYLQRMTGNNTYGLGWPSSGVLVSNGSGQMTGVVLASDGNYGAFVAWQESDSLTGDNDIYLQHVTSSGKLGLGWPARGIQQTLDSDEQANPRIIADQSGGAIVVWRDAALGYIHGRRSNASGGVLGGWGQFSTKGAELITRYTTSSDGISLRSDGANGAYIAVSGSGSSPPNIFVQHVNESGGLPWNSTGINVGPTNGTQSNPSLAIDILGNVIVAWEDERDGPSGDIYCQRLSPHGDVRWLAAGVPLCTQSALQRRLGLVSDGKGGAIALWADGRGENVYTQRVDSLGTVKWMPDGVALTASNEVPQNHDIATLSDGLGGAYVAWYDYRATGLGAGVYEARVDSSDHTGTAAVVVSGLEASPDNGGVFMRWNAFASGVAEFRVRRGDSGSGAMEVVSEIFGGRAGRQEYSFRDSGVSPGAAYNYELQYRELGDWLVGGRARVTLPAASFALAAPQPNPSRGIVRIGYQLARTGFARIEIFDCNGARVRRLVNASMPAGGASAEWDGRDDSGMLAASGVYFVRFEQRGGSLTRRIVRLP